MCFGGIGSFKYIVLIFLFSSQEKSCDVEFGFDKKGNKISTKSFLSLQFGSLFLAFTKSLGRRGSVQSEFWDRFLVMVKVFCGIALVIFWSSLWSICGSYLAVKCWKDKRLQLSFNKCIMDQIPLSNQFWAKSDLFFTVIYPQFHRGVLCVGCSCVCSLQFNKTCWWKDEREICNVLMSKLQST